MYLWACFVCHNNVSGDMALCHTTVFSFFTYHLLDWLIWCNANRNDLFALCWKQIAWRILLFLHWKGTPSTTSSALTVGRETKKNTAEPKCNGKCRLYFKLSQHLIINTTSVIILIRLKVSVSVLVWQFWHHCVFYLQRRLEVKYNIEILVGWGMGFKTTVGFSNVGNFPHFKSCSFYLRKNWGILLMFLWFW